MSLELLSQILRHHEYKVGDDGVVAFSYVNGNYVVLIHDDHRCETFYGIHSALEDAILQAVTEYSKEDYVN